ncbi:hypothetical protein WICPIJ_008742 [Wickerhamomyces pijperi]|uniref:Uncharacterized protein n=1 Tax=Wickerhamomyces pijperi TaxID=599730 RepID=A0A9P8PVB5_WICPI|nr:hypothetical protein WICPIJ_008742 [Wickerhamomyces pijperi]
MFIKTVALLLLSSLPSLTLSEATNVQLFCNYCDDSIRVQTSLETHSDSTANHYDTKIKLFKPASLLEGYSTKSLLYWNQLRDDPNTVTFNWDNSSVIAMRREYGYLVSGGYSDSENFVIPFNETNAKLVKLYDYQCEMSKTCEYSITVEQPAFYCVEVSTGSQVEATIDAEFIATFEKDYKVYVARYFPVIVAFFLCACAVPFIRHWKQDTDSTSTRDSIASSLKFSKWYIIAAAIYLGRKLILSNVGTKTNLNNTGLSNLSYDQIFGYIQSEIAVFCFFECVEHGIIKTQLFNRFLGKTNIRKSAPGYPMSVWFFTLSCLLHTILIIAVIMDTRDTQSMVHVITHYIDETIRYPTSPPILGSLVGIDEILPFIRNGYLYWLIPFLVMVIAERRFVSCKRKYSESQNSSESDDATVDESEGEEFQCMEKAGYDLNKDVSITRLERDIIFKFECQILYIFGWYPLAVLAFFVPILLLDSALKNSELSTLDHYMDFVPYSWIMFYGLIYQDLFIALWLMVMGLIDLHVLRSRKENRAIVKIFPRFHGLV